MDLPCCSGIPDLSGSMQEAAKEKPKPADGKPKDGESLGYRLERQCLITGAVALAAATLHQLIQGLHLHLQKL